MQRIEPCWPPLGKCALRESKVSETPWPDGVPAIMPAEDRAEIEELFARYAWGIDLADEEQAINTFAEDAEFDHLWQGKVRGHAAIRLHVNAWTGVDQIPWKGERTLPMRPPYKPEAADTRPFDEQTKDGW